MGTSRPITLAEYDRLKEAPRGRMALRDRLLIVLLRWSGLRIAEALSIRRGDVVDFGKVLPEFSVARNATKGRRHGCVVLVPPELARALADWLRHMDGEGWSTAEVWLFRAMGPVNRPISQTQGWRIIRRWARHADVQLPGPVSPHSLRKTFGIDVYERSGHDIRVAQAALRHDNHRVTEVYLAVMQKRLRRLLMGERDLPATLPPVEELARMASDSQRQAMMNALWRMGVRPARAGPGAETDR